MFLFVFNGWRCIGYFNHACFTASNGDNVRRACVGVLGGVAGTDACASGGGEPG